MAQPASSSFSVDRLADRIAPAVLCAAFPPDKVQEALSARGRNSQRHRALPAPLVVCHVMTLSLWRAGSCREVLRWLMQGLRFSGLDVAFEIPVKSALSQARDRRGSDVMVHRHDTLVGPVAEPQTKGAG